MTSYTNVFGGNAIKPADTSYVALAITAAATLNWPATGQSPSTSAIMEISSNAAYDVTMPSALRVSPGETVSVKNTGSFTLTFKDAAGGTIVAVGAGLTYDIFVKTNATAAGTWGSLQRGAGTSAANAADLDGDGLEANGALLQATIPVVSYAISASITTTSRAKLVEWTGGTGAFTIAACATLGNGWFCYFKNNGTGTVTLTPAGAELINAAATLALSPGQGCILGTDGVDYTSIAMNDPVAATLAYASISVAGTGNYTLSATEYANKAIKFTGLLTGNRVIIVPTSLREYYVSNQTTGAYTLTVKTSAGSGVAVTQTKAAVLYCDGTDVVAAETDEGAGISTPVSIANGGTSATTAGAALTALGGTATGTAVFTAANAAAALSAISGAGVTANTFSDTQTITKNDAATNTVTDLFVITHSTSGVAAAGFGGGLVYKLEDAAGSIETVASIDAVLTDATDATEDVKLSFKTMIAGAAKTEVSYLGAGWVVGAATGGDKGIGTLNSVSLYQNGTIISSIYAPLASPTFTGTPAAPTAAAGTNTTQIATTAFVAAAVVGALQPGDLKWAAYSATPSGFLPCDGSAVSRATYSALFTAISTTWGVGDGATTFNVPDFRGRVPVGAGTGTVAETQAAANFATTDIITVTSNPMNTSPKWLTGMPVQVTTSGVLPTGIAAVTTYYVIRLSATTISLASSLSNAMTGTAVNITAIGSGNHTITCTLAARTIAEMFGTELNGAVPQHDHAITTYVPSGGATDGVSRTASGSSSHNNLGTNSTGSSEGVTNMPPSAVVHVFIKT